MDESPANIVLLGLAGVFGLLTGALTHFQEQAEFAMRMGTMMVGLGVSVLSGMVLWRKWRRNREDEDDE